MMNRFLIFCFVFLLGCFCTNHVLGQVFAGLTADFEDNTTQGFGVGASGLQPSLLGIDDNFVLQNESLGGTGPNSAQLIQNQTTFAGDYITTGIVGISATVAVAPTSDGPLSLRLSFTDDVSGGGTGFSSGEALVVQNDGEFVDLFFEINETALVSVPGTGTTSFEDVLSNVERLRILAAVSGPSYVVSGSNGDRVASTLLIDNITAVGVPEPASGTLILMAGLAISIQRKRRRL